MSGEGHPRQFTARAGPSGDSVTRYFYFWCEKCPTRIHLQTEVQQAAPDGQPTYDFAESEWVGQCEQGHVADRCPACGGPLRDTDDLVAREYLPLKGWDPEREPELHAIVREALKHPDKPGPFPWGRKS